MSQTTADLAAAQQIPNEQATTDLYGASLAGTSASDVRQGFASLGDNAADQYTLADASYQREDDDGSTYNGNPYEMGGFLPRQHGYGR